MVLVRILLLSAGCLSWDAATADEGGERWVPWVVRCTQSNELERFSPLDGEPTMGLGSIWRRMPGGQFEPFHVGPTVGGTKDGSHGLAVERRFFECRNQDDEFARSVLGRQVAEATPHLHGDLVRATSVELRVAGLRRQTLLVEDYRAALGRIDKDLLRDMRSRAGELFYVSDSYKLATLSVALRFSREDTLRLQPLTQLRAGRLRMEWLRDALVVDATPDAHLLGSMEPLELVLRRTFTSRLTNDVGEVTRLLSIFAGK